MKKSLKIFFLFSFFAAASLSAQMVVKNDTLAGTPLAMSMDKKIDDLLVGLEEKCALSNRPASGRGDSGESSAGSTPNRVTTPERELSRAEICRRNPRIMGYKIQLAVVKSNEEAREVGMFFRRRFPNIKVEIDASLRPNYKVMAGSYISKQSIAPDLAKVRAYFKSAMAIQYRVFCVEAK